MEKKTNIIYIKAFILALLSSVGLNLNMTIYSIEDLAKYSLIEEMDGWFRLLWDIRLSSSGYSIEKLLILGFLTFLFVKTLDIVDKEISKNSILPAALFAFFEVFGKSFKETSSWNLVFANFRTMAKAGIKYVGLFILFYHLCKLFLVVMRDYIFKKEEQKVIQWFTHNKKSIFVCFGLILIMWLPYAISNFPGLTNYDFFDMLDTFYGNNTNSIRVVVPISEDVTLNNNNPVLQTMMAVGFMKLGDILGSPYIGIFAFCYLQMILFAFVLSYSLYFMSRYGVSNKYRALILLFYGLNPWHANFALTTLKDTNFSFVMLLYVMFMIDLVVDCDLFLQNKKKLCIFTLINLLLMLLRNNGVYVLIVVNVILLIAFRKKWKRMVIPTVIPVFVYMVLITNVLYPALKISPGSKAEMYSVPLQQIARLAKEHPDAIQGKDLEIVKKVLPKYDEFAERYSPEISDPIKSTYNKYTTPEEMSDFLSVWAKYLKKYPAVYVQATTCNCYGYFYPEAEHWLVYTDIAKPGLNYGVESPEALSKLRKEWNQMAYILKFVPGLGMLMSVGFYTWIMIFALMWICYNKAYKMAIMWSPFLVLLLTVLIGPVNTMPRYVYPIILGTPMLFVMSAKLTREWKEAKQTEKEKQA